MSELKLILQTSVASTQRELYVIKIWTHQIAGVKLGLIYGWAEITTFHRRPRHQKIDVACHLLIRRNIKSMTRLIGSRCEKNAPLNALSAPNNFRNRLDGGFATICCKRKLTKRKNNKSRGQVVRGNTLEARCVQRDPHAATPRLHPHFFFALWHAINSDSQCDATADFSPSRWISQLLLGNLIKFTLAAADFASLGLKAMLLLRRSRWIDENSGVWLRAPLNSAPWIGNEVYYGATTTPP